MRGSPGASGVLGDYDDNHLVDDVDYETWRSSYFLSVPRGTGADGNRNGIVDTADFVIWRKAASAAPAAGASVAISAAAVGGAAPIVGGVRGADIEPKISPSRTPSVETLFTHTTASAPSVRQAPARRSSLGLSDPTRDLALLLALQRRGASTVEVEPVSIRGDGEPATKGAIEWIDDAFASLTLL
jgi:hypothetical protein